MVAGAERGGRGSWCLMDTEFQFGKMKKFRRYTTVMTAQQYECTEHHRTELWAENFMLYVVYRNKNKNKAKQNERSITIT